MNKRLYFAVALITSYFFVGEWFYFLGWNSGLNQDRCIVNYHRTYGPISGCSNELLSKLTKWNE